MAEIPAIHCALPPGFWHDRPEINDARLSDWLKFKVFHKRPCRSPLLMEMIPIDKNLFRLQLLQAKSVRPQERENKPVKQEPASMRHS